MARAAILKARIDFGTKPMWTRSGFCARFYEAASGREPVRDWLRDLDPPARRVVGLDIKRVEYGGPIGMPLCRSLGRGLWEVRSDLRDKRIARVIFARARRCHGSAARLHQEDAADPAGRDR